MGKEKEDILPKNPLKVRTVISPWIFGANAVGICNSANIEKQTRYSFLRPKVSERGARISGPIPSRTTKPVVAPTTTSPVVLRSSAICSMPGVNMLDANGDNTVPYS